MKQWNGSVGKKNYESLAMKKKHRHNSRFKRLFLFQYKGESPEIIQKQVASIHEKNAFDVAFDPSSCLSMLSEWKEK